MHIDYRETVQSATQSAISQYSNCTLEELDILKEIIQNPSITQKDLAYSTGMSERTIKRKTVELQEKRVLRRKNGKRNGKREVLVKI
mgnify:CR=1 FL=1